jgi:hypothetical protein
MTRMGRMLTLLRTAVLLFAGSAHAPSVDKIIKLKIPFESTVGNKSFPAGSYSLVHTPPGYVILGDSQSHPVKVAISRSVQAYTAPTTPKLET